MPEIKNSTIAICIQALEDATKHYNMLSQSETVDSDNFEECIYMYEVELARLCEIYRKEEEKGNTQVPLASLLKDTELGE